MSVTAILNKTSSWGLDGQIRGEGMPGCTAIYEVVRIGAKKLLGEVHQCQSDGSKSSCIIKAISPLDAIKAATGGSPYFTPGLCLPELCNDVKWRFMPTPGLAVGDAVQPGDIVGTVDETPLVVHKVMVPPDVAGIVLTFVGSGDFSVEETIMTVETERGSVVISMMQRWPVRRPRPVAEKLPATEPLCTGVRVLDTMFPMAMGGTAVVCGGFGTGKTCIANSLTAHCNHDVAVHVSCGTRGNEVLELKRLLEKTTICGPRIVLTRRLEAVLLGTRDPKSPWRKLHGNWRMLQLILSMAGGCDVGVMARTVSISTTCDSSFLSHEVAILKGLCFSEYLRDQGYRVGLMIDSISECTIGGDPLRATDSAYLSSHLAGGYDRAGKAECLGSLPRHGLMTLITAVSAPSGDFAAPVPCTALARAQTFWALDRGLAQRRHYPALNYLVSYTKYVGRYDRQTTLRAGGDIPGALREYFARLPGFSRAHAMVMDLLQTQTEIEEIVQLVGAGDHLTEDQHLIRAVAQEIVIPTFLPQDMCTEYDTVCPLEKSVGMLKCIAAYYERALTRLEMRHDPIVWTTIQERTRPILQKLTAMCFFDCSTCEDAACIVSYFAAVEKEIEATFDELDDPLAVLYRKILFEIRHS